MIEREGRAGRRGGKVKGVGQSGEITRAARA